ncbi:MULTISPECIES: biotin/lipoyl-binding carrier protein [Saccharopolyspora]|uniref:Biotin/lipoyl-binding carrier protein n=1 Tax=Saccharopolyspora elongata TaxID=2530387 RepID=A0A4R4Z3R9_9PSEU|nr:biotin/lipoyl-binding carrier protein [Saccharopolyspora elongata]TDD51664.1 biotin/lipoyl-binding carrier protein [Saccharopolyspora elongata]
MEIKAEMVANVWKVLVTEGTAVKADQELAVLESMKMEIPVLSETDGVVTRVAVAEGDAVNEGDLIAVVSAE